MISATLHSRSFPKVMGVLTHLDKFRDNGKLQKTKRRLKHRFWTEGLQLAALFAGFHLFARYSTRLYCRIVQWRTARNCSICRVWSTTSGTRSAR